MKNRRKYRITFIGIVVVLTMITTSLYVSAQVIVSDPAAVANDIILAEHAAAQKAALDAKQAVRDAKSLIQSEAIAKQTLQLSEDMKAIKEAKEKFDWLKELKTVARLVTLLESVYCMQKTMTIHIEINQALNLSCLGQIEINKILLNYDMASDFIKLAIGTSALAMDPGDRIKTLDMAVTKLEKSIELMNRFNVSRQLDMQSAMESLVEKEKVRPMFDIRRGVVK